MTDRFERALSDIELAMMSLKNTEHLIKNDRPKNAMYRLNNAITNCVNAINQLNDWQDE